MKEWSGIIEEISDKDWNGVILWSFKLEGVDRWFRTRKTKVPAEVGDQIKFSERNLQVALETIVLGDAPESESKYANGAKGTVPVHHAPDTPRKSAGTPASTNVGSTNNAATTDAGSRIQWLAARADATNVIVAALKMDALPWASNVAKSKKLDLLRGYIKELTQQFLEDENG